MLWSKASEQTLDHLAGQSVHGVRHTVNASRGRVRHGVVTSLDGRSETLGGALDTVVDWGKNRSVSFLGLQWVFEGD